jgi:nitrite reductase/ring-hydroxylating ferredoxin subunit
MYYTPDRATDLASRLFKLVAQGTTDMVDETFEYDLSIYADPDLVETEQIRIFERLPMLALHSAQVPEAGSYATVRLSRSVALVTRDKNGAVRAFLNTCRHRGAQLVAEGAGRQALFTCPYHGWTYANDGALKAITFPETYGQRPCTALNLIALPVEERHGFIWIVENPAGAIDVAAHLGPGMDQAMAEYHFENWSCYRTETFAFSQNWKVMMDGLIDGYHVQFLHGATINPYFVPNTLGIQVHGRHALWGNPRRRISEIMDQPPGSVGLERYVIFGNIITPNSALVLHPHHVEYWTVYQDPASVGRCFLQLRYLTPQPIEDARGHEIMAKNWTIATSAIISEDVPVGNSIQTSARSRFVGKARLGRNEVINQLFHRAYRHHMGWDDPA